MRYTSFDDFCRQKGLDPVAVLPNVDGFPAQHQAALLATAKLFLLVEAINDGWKPDWNDDDEYKYYPWFDMEYHKKNNPAGFRFYAAGYDCAHSGVGSRLCFRTREDAVFAGETYLDLYRALMVLE